MNALSLNGVNKHYGSKLYFDYYFHDGVYGLLGPNGAGKSAMMNVITQNIPADSDSTDFKSNNKESAASDMQLAAPSGKQTRLLPYFTHISCIFRRLVISYYRIKRRHFYEYMA